MCTCPLPRPFSMSIKWNVSMPFQQDGLAMSVPSLGLIAVLFLQHLEHSHLTRIIQKHRLINYCWYIDDIFLIFDSEHTNTQKILEDFNSLQAKLHLTAEVEKDHAITFLDTSLHRGPNNIITSIYRNPISTDIIIPFNSNHRAQHKYAAIRYLYNRLNSENLQKEHLVTYLLHGAESLLKSWLVCR
jgi:hypothetical protein